MREYKFRGLDVTQNGSCLSSSKVNVLGNIHEHPELLKTNTNCQEILDSSKGEKNDA